MEPSLSCLCGSQKAHAPFVSGGTRTGSVLPSGTAPFSCPTSRPDIPRPSLYTQAPNPATLKAQPWRGQDTCPSRLVQSLLGGGDWPPKHTAPPGVKCVIRGCILSPPVKPWPSVCPEPGGTLLSAQGRRPGHVLASQTTYPWDRARSRDHKTERAPKGRCPGPPGRARTHWDPRPWGQKNTSRARSSASFRQQLY